MALAHAAGVGALFVEGLISELAHTYSLLRPGLSGDRRRPVYETAGWPRHRHPTRMLPNRPALHGAVKPLRSAMTTTPPTEEIPGLGVTVERDVEATMRDGTVLRSDVYRPRTGSDLPVLLIRSIYDKRSGTALFGSAHPAWFAAQGYVVVSQDCRGRYASEGDFYPYLHEINDGYDSVEWAARLPGSDGQVGMMGFSYVGATQLLAAIAAPPSLASITPAFTASQYYDGWTYNGGALALAFIGYWATLLASRDRPAGRGRGGSRPAGGCPRQRSGLVLVLARRRLPPAPGAIRALFQGLGGSLFLRRLLEAVEHRRGLQPDRCSRPCT